MKIEKSISIVLVCLLAMFILPIKTFTQITVGIGITTRNAPPPLPYYEQPQCPVDGYLWEPGYWAYDGYDYYWVPGVWVYPPQPGYLWTPCYWGFSGGYYGYHEGYWGSHIGYYGGVNYGYGYGGSGYYGGRWEGNHFRYNTAVVNVNSTVVHNTYIDRSVVVNNRTSNRSSFNGPGGVNAKPTKQEETAMRESHIKPTSEQTSHQKAASKDKAHFASTNKGRPAIVAVNKVETRSVNQQQHSAPIAQKNVIQQTSNEPKKQTNTPVHNEVNKPSIRPANNDEHKTVNHPVEYKSNNTNNRPVAIQQNKPASQSVNHNTETHQAQQPAQHVHTAPQQPTQHAHTAPQQQAPRQAQAQHEQSEGHENRR
jgi:hypothetical protein